MSIVDLTGGEHLRRSWKLVGPKTASTGYYHTPSIITISTFGGVGKRSVYDGRRYRSLVVMILPVAIDRLHDQMQGNEN